MKKNLPFSLLVLFTVLAGISCNTAYQSQLVQNKTFSINKREQKKIVDTPVNLMADKLKDEESCELFNSLSLPEDQYKEGNKINDEILAKEIRDVDIVIGGHNYKYFNNHITYQSKKVDDIIENKVSRAGIVLDRLDFEFTKFSGKKIGKFSYNFCFTKNRGVKIFF